MRHLTIPAMVGALALAAPLLTASDAHAGLAACGDISVEASAECSLEVEGGCTARCEPINFKAACSAEGYASCDGMCDLPSVMCDASCEGSCMAECDVDPGNFDCSANCEGSCMGGCEANCMGKCEGEADRASCEGSCMASCDATCSGECEASCEGTPPMAECSGQCQASCQGSCTADTNFDCQIDCQAMLEVSCSASLQGGCEAECSKPEGALFCDSQYVDHGGNLQECLDALKAELNIEVMASGSASCEGGSCQAEGEVSVSGCAVSPTSSSSAPLSAGFALTALAGLFVGRRRRRS